MYNYNKKILCMGPMICLWSVCYIAVWFYIKFKFASLTILSQLTFFDGAVIVTAGAGLFGSMCVSTYKGAGVGMFVGAAVLILVKVTL